MRFFGRASRDDVEWIHDHKTAALIQAALEVGVLAGGGPRDTLDLVRAYGALLGRAFQIADDCLDVTGDAARLGKQPGQDQAAQKLTYPAVIGIEASLTEAKRLAAAAAALAPRICTRRPGSDTRLDPSVRVLQDVALYVVVRKA